MQAAQVTDWAAGPKFSKVPKPDAPADESVVQIRVLAAAIHQLVRSRAAGTHYTSGPLPHTPGVDGTGVDVATGKHVYFSVLSGSPSTGSFAEYVNVRRQAVVPLPEGVDPVMAAALTNPVMGSWMALHYRAELKPGWRAFIIGATSASGRLAIKVARQLGAEKVYGAGRNAAALAELGLDGIVVLDDKEPAKTDFSAAQSATVVLDYLWGPWPAAFLSYTAAAGVKTALQWVSIGAMAGDDTAVSSVALRSREVSFRGSGPGAWHPALLAKETAGMLKVLTGMEDDGSGKLVKRLPMREIEEAWKIKGPRVVLVNEE